MAEPRVEKFALVCISDVWMGWIWLESKKTKFGRCLKIPRNPTHPPHIFGLPF